MDFHLKLCCGVGRDVPWSIFTPSFHLLFQELNWRSYPDIAPKQISVRNNIFVRFSSLPISQILQDNFYYVNICWKILHPWELSHCGWVAVWGFGAGHIHLSLPFRGQRSHLCCTQGNGETPFFYIVSTRQIAANFASQFCILIYSITKVGWLLTRLCSIVTYILCNLLLNFGYCNAALKLHNLQ